MNINVFSTLYDIKNPSRKKEIYTCINKNYNNKDINYILIRSEDKLKYNDYFNLINNYSNEEDINIISNLDIYFDETINLCKQITKEHFLALSRWEMTGNIVKFGNRQDSQDCWIYKGKINNINGDFYTGMQGCDNRIAYEAEAAGYQVINPSLDIKTYHVHVCNVRDYKVGDLKTTVPRPHAVVKPRKFNLFAIYNKLEVMF